MQLNKLGLVFDLEKNKPDWIKSHAMTPSPIVLEDKVRVYYSGRGQDSQSRVSYFDLDINDLSKIIYIHPEPLFDVGSDGAFDDSGVIVTSVVKNGDLIYMYYTGYSQAVKVPYRNAVGLAISKDNGETFEREFDGPVLDRSPLDPYFVISPCVVKMEKEWLMWYSACTNWIEIDGKKESVYHIKVATSNDGIHWNKLNQSCVLPKYDEEAIARPSVLFLDEIKAMLYTYRGSRDFRDGNNAYKIGLAFPKDGNYKEVWERKDEEVNLELDEFDSSMQAYPSFISVNNSTYVFYNGNGFGYNGIALAKIESI